MQGSDLIEALQNSFSLHIREIRPLGGGDIAKSYLLNTSKGPVFAKIMDASKGLQMLQAEREGLQAISNTDTLMVPEVLGCDSTPAGSCLLLEYIPPGSGSRDSSKALGRGLARMHQASATSFGWHRSNYIGSLPQENTAALDWTAFYIQNRLVPQYELARPSMN
ncbi:MAG: fructosamine kinase family protein [Robiginitalea sp.]